MGNVRIAGERNLVMVLDETSPAAQAGLQRRDLIKEIDGHAIKNQYELEALVTAKSPGDTLRLKVERGNETLYFDVTLEEREDINFSLSFMEKPSPQQVKIREGLLKGDQVE
jgi:S1-C subfamily serine protease